MKEQQQESVKERTAAADQQKLTQKTRFAGDSSCFIQHDDALLEFGQRFCNEKGIILLKR